MDGRTLISAAFRILGCGDARDHVRGEAPYEFRIGDRTYAGRGNPGSTNPSCDRLKPGHTISVRYLVADPGESLPGDIDDRLRNEWLSVVVAAFGIPLIILFFARRQFGRWGGAPSS